VLARTLESLLSDPHTEPILFVKKLRYDETPLKLVAEMDGDKSKGPLKLLQSEVGFSCLFKHAGKYLCLDSDMFLVADFDVAKYAGYDCAVVLQSRTLSAGRNMNMHMITGQSVRKAQAHYSWNGIYYFDMTRMKNIGLLNWNCCPNCDVGGMMQEWLRVTVGGAVPDTDQIRWTTRQFHTSSVYFMKHLWSGSWDMTEMPPGLKQNTKLVEFFQTDPRNTNGKYFCEIYDDAFLHYRAGGNWRNEGAAFHAHLSQLLKQCL
jgi:hypothetical protein